MEVEVGGMGVGKVFTKQERLEKPSTNYGYLKNKEGGTQINLPFKYFLQLLDSCINSVANIMDAKLICKISSSTFPKFQFLNKNWGNPSQYIPLREEVLKQ